MQPLLPWKSSITYSECICSLRYPACNSCASYCSLWPVRFYNIFPHYLINDKPIGGVVLNSKCVFWFSLQRFVKHFSF